MQIAKHCIPALNTCKKSQKITGAYLAGELLYSSTVCVHFYYVQAHSAALCYCIPALCACIYTIFKHFSGCTYTRLSFCGCIFYPLCVFPLCTLCSMAPNNVCTLCSIPHTLCAHCVQWLPHCLHTVYNGVSPNLKISNTLTSYLTGNSVQDT